MPSVNLNNFSMLILHDTGGEHSDAKIEIQKSTIKYKSEKLAQDLCSSTLLTYTHGVNQKIHHMKPSSSSFELIPYQTQISLYT